MVPTAATPLDPAHLTFRATHVVASLDLKYGGPSRSVFGLARAQARVAAPVALATLGQPKEDLGPHPGLTIAWAPAGRPRRLCRSRVLRQFLREHAFQAVHHHGLWLRPLHYAYQEACRAKVPLVLSPRGMMNRWSWEHHRRRKLLASLVVHPGAMAGASAWHATSADEADEIRSLGFRQPICVAPNGVDVPNETQLAIAREHWLEAVPEARSRPVALFYSRFHSKKRLTELIDLWVREAPKEWLLLVIGIPDEYTVAEVNHYVLCALGKGQIRVFDGTYRPPPYALASLFLLPSHSENFGLSIAEALAAGVPALVTDTTPWEELNRNGAGWCVPWPAYRDALADALREDEAVRRQRGRVGRDWVQHAFSWDQSAQQLMSFYPTLRPAT